MLHKLRKHTDILYGAQIQEKRKNANNVFIRQLTDEDKLNQLLLLLFLLSKIQSRVSETTVNKSIVILSYTLHDVIEINLIIVENIIWNIK